MNKLYTRIDWENNTTPALNETNLNLMSKGIDDIDDRVVYLANEVIVDTTVKMNKDGSNAENAVTFPGSLTTGGNITDGNGNVLSNKMETDGNNAASEVTFAGAFTVGSRSGSVGPNSVAEGNSVEAPGDYSHAEGYQTTASGIAAHAEGYQTTASGDYSHAEGNHTTASGDYSHAEGRYTTASKDDSHAEGRYTTASKISAHAEGWGTTASGIAAHAEGTYTKAGSDFQHVRGKYNVEDTNNVYADIVGGGTSDNNRANIETLDWSGNFWVAGKASDGGGKLGNESLLTDAYDAATTYGPIGNANNYPSWCIDGNVLYKNISQCVGVQPPNVTYWKATDVASELSALNNSLTGNITTWQGAGTHNSIYRGKNLGSVYSGTQQAAISSGTFDDLYIGDYWTISGMVYRIAAFDYWLNCGDIQCTTHHAVIVPDTNLYIAKMNSNSTASGGYVGSAMYTTNLDTAKNTINTAFGSANILNHREMLTNAISGDKASSWEWYDSTVELMNESMVYGHNAWESAPGYETGIDKGQLSLFRLDPSKITNRAGWWLRGVCTAANFALVGRDGFANNGAASNAIGVRPAFGIK